MDQKDIAVEAIKKKLIGKTLSYQEIYAIMDELAHARLGPVLTTYFTAAAFKEGFSDEELYDLTRAMVETGPTLAFDGIVADKHSIGGVAGGRTSLIIVPIVAAAGFRIPKNSSRAITSPAGTADAMEVLAPVIFSASDVTRFVDKVGGCIVWGGALGLAPADDVIITVTEQIAFESYDKMIVAIMAKKIASGANHIVFDIPVGKGMKVHHEEDAKVIERKLLFLANKFSLKATATISVMDETPGVGVGPLLEARDALQVLEQQKERAQKLEQKSLELAGKLLSLCFADTPGKEQENGHAVAEELLRSGKALQKMKEIIKIQGGNPDIESSHLMPACEQLDILSSLEGNVTEVRNKEIITVCRILGCPEEKGAGVYLHARMGDHVAVGDILCTLYSLDSWKIKEAKETLKMMPIFTII